MSEGTDTKSTGAADRQDVRSRLAAVRKRCEGLRGRVPVAADAASTWPRDLNAASGTRPRDWGDDPVESAGE